MPPSAPAKICIRCKQDCSQRPRTKDDKGRYICQACIDAANAKPASQKPATKPALALEPAIVNQDLPPAEIYAVEPEATPRPKAKPVGACPSCGEMMAGGAVVCINCGFDRSKNLKAGPPERVKKPPAKKGVSCPSCGYSLSGLREMRCPECGELVTESAIKRQQRSERDRKAVLVSYLAPVILLVGGLGIGLAFSADALGVPGVIATLILFAFQFVIAFVIYLGCCALWMGMAASLHLSALQLASCLGLYQAIFWSILTMTGGVMHWTWYIGIVVIVVLAMAKVMDLDWEDAFIMGAFIGTAWVLVPLFLILLGLR